MLAAGLGWHGRRPGLWPQRHSGGWGSRVRLCRSQRRGRGLGGHGRQGACGTRGRWTHAHSSWRHGAGVVAGGGRGRGLPASSHPRAVLHAPRSTSPLARSVPGPQPGGAGWGGPADGPPPALKCLVSNLCPPLSRPHWQRPRNWRRGGTNPALDAGWAQTGVTNSSIVVCPPRASPPPTMLPTSAVLAVRPSRNALHAPPVEPSLLRAKALGLSAAVGSVFLGAAYLFLTAPYVLTPLRFLFAPCTDFAIRTQQEGGPLGPREGSHVLNASPASSRRAQRSAHFSQGVCPGLRTVATKPPFRPFPSKLHGSRSGSLLGLTYDALCIANPSFAGIVVYFAQRSALGVEQSASRATSSPPVQRKG